MRCQAEKTATKLQHPIDAGRIGERLLIEAVQGAVDAPAIHFLQIDVGAKTGSIQQIAAPAPEQEIGVGAPYEPIVAGITKDCILAIVNLLVGPIKARFNLVVEVTAEQFAWNVHYPGPDRVFGRADIKLLDLQSNPLGIDRSDPAAKDDVTTLNQLYLPANRPIIVRLRSKDVIHSFNLPEFRVKQDAIPGFTIPVWFTPDVTTAEMRTRTSAPLPPTWGP